MSNIKVKPDQVADAIIKALGEYGDKVLTITDEVSKSVSRETTSALKASSPVNTGRYARGWSHRQHKTVAYGRGQVVYNRTDYQLIHLLEKPHETGGGGHYPSKKDHTGIVARIEEQKTQEFYQEVLSKL